MPAKSIGQHAINVVNGKVSHIYVKARGAGVKFPDPALNTYSATVSDTNNNFNFDFAPPVVIPQPDDGATPYPTKRAAIRISSNLPGGGGSNPTDGVLSVTITVTNTATTTTSTIQVADVPVDYISDPV